MKPLLITLAFLVFRDPSFIFGESEKEAYSLQSLEMTRSHQILELYTDTVVRTYSGIWDLETDTLLARGNDGRNFGIFLDFDLSSGFALYRREEYDSALRKSRFVFEARNRDGEVVFTKTDTISHNPEAFFIADGAMILSRTNDASTLELTLELHAIATGERIWRHTPGGSPRWRLSDDSQIVIELLSDQTENYFHTAVAYDTLTLAELDRSDLRGLKIRRESQYLSSLATPVGVLSGQSGTLLANEVSKTLSPIPNFRASTLYPDSSPKLDAQARYIILGTYNNFGGDTWILYNARTGERIAGSRDLELESSSSRFSRDPAISHSGELLYQNVGNGKIEVWNPHTKKLVRELSYTNIPFESLVPSADDRYLLALVLSGLNDDFMVLIDTVTNLPIYSEIIRDPNIFEPPSDFGYVTGFTRTFTLSPSGDRFYFSTVQGFEAYDFKTGKKIEDGSKFTGKAITSAHVAAQKSWVTVYETGRVKIESETTDTPVRWIQLPNTAGLRYAAIDNESGSVAFQRDTAFFITHPFDEREDQWVSKPLGDSFAMSLHHGGKWLAAEYRGIYDLEIKEWLPQTSPYFYVFAIDSASKRWVEYDPNLETMTIYDLESDSQTDLPLSGQLTSIRAIRFSADGKQVYCLAMPTSGSFNDQSIFVFDGESGSILQQVELIEMAGSYDFTQMQVYPNGRKVLLGRRDGTNKSVNLDTLEESLPVFIEPILSAEFDNGRFYLSEPNADGTFRFVDEYGHTYQLQETTAFQIPFKILPSSVSESRYLFDEDPESEYWIQASADLKHWSTLPYPEGVENWFHDNDAGFFKIFESQPPK